MISPALTRLIAWLFYGALRRLTHQMRKPLGFLVGILAIGSIVFGIFATAVSLWFGSTAYSSLGSFSAAFPFAMYLVVTIFASLNAGRQVVEMRPAELQFVVAGPFSDKQILNYRLMVMTLSFLPMAMVFSVFAGTVCSGYLSGLAMSLGFVLTMMLSVTFWALVKPHLPASIRTVVVIALWIPIFWLAAATTVWFVNLDGPLSSIWSLVVVPFLESWPIRILTSPFIAVANLGTQPLGLATVINGAIVLLIQLALIQGCYWACDGFAERAVSGIQRRQDAFLKARSGNWSTKENKGSLLGRRIGLFPWVGGAGPVAWMEFVTVLRSLGRIMAVSIVISVSAVIFIAFGRAFGFLDLNAYMEARKWTLPIFVCGSMGVFSYLAMLMIGISPHGFSVAPRTLTNLRLLPIAGLPLATGAMFGYGAGLALFRLLILIPALVADFDQWPLGLAIYCYGVALDLNIVSALNLVSVSTDVRMVGGSSPDVLQGGRAMLFMLLIILAAVPGIVVSILAASIGFFMLGNQPLWLFMVASLAILLFLIPILWFTGWQFGRRESAAYE